MARRVTLRMVADVAHVSVATASLAISGSPRVAEKTCRAVKSAARQLGYVRNLAFSCIASGHFRHADISPRVASWMEIGSPWQAQLRTLATTLGMDVRSLPDDPGNLGLTLHRIRATALVVYRRNCQAISWPQLPVHTVLWLDEGMPTPETDVIETQEWWNSTVGGIQHLWDAGYRHPAVVAVAADPRHWHDDVRKAAAQAQGVPFLEWDGTTASVQQFVHRHAPDSILGGIAAVASRLLSCGIDLPFASLLISLPNLHRGIAGWVPDCAARDLATVELIEGRMRHGPRAPRRIVLAPRWQDGVSLPMQSG